MNSEDKITEWLTGSAVLRESARHIARGRPVPPEGEIFEYGDQDLMEWVFDLLYSPEPAWLPGMASGYAAKLGVRMTESEVCQANWQVIRASLLGM